MPLLIAFMVVSFGALYYYDKGNVFKYQFVMYGAAITLFPIVIGAFRYLSRSGRRNELSAEPVQQPIPGIWALLSILIGLLAVFGSFFLRNKIHGWSNHYLSVDIPEDAISDLAPLTGLVAATVLYWVGMFVRMRNQGK